MQVVFILIGASVLLAAGFLIAFISASKRGQFKDTYTPSVRILFDDTKQECDNNNKPK